MDPGLHLSKHSKRMEHCVAKKQVDAVIIYSLIPWHLSCLHV